MSNERKAEAGFAGAPGSAFPHDTGDDALCNVRRLRAEIRMLRDALQPLADLLDGDLENVGGGTLIAPTIKVQIVKDAKNALREQERTYGSLKRAGSVAVVKRINGHNQTLCPKCGVRWKRDGAAQCRKCARLQMWKRRREGTPPNEKAEARRPGQPKP